MNEVIIYSKKDCCLCDRAKQVLLKVKENTNFTLQEKDIITDKELLKKYQTEIPVIFVNGKKKFKFFIEEKRLRRLLNEK